MRALLIATLVLVAPAAFARPLIATPTPTPSPTATPEPAATATAIATATPEPTIAPVASPTPSPENSATPVETPAAEETPVPLATPIDYTAGPPGSPHGPHPLRGAFMIGVHSFGGLGWDRPAGPPPDDAPPRPSDFVGGSLSAAAIYDVNPVLAVVATIGGHNGTHTPKVPAAAAHVTTSYNAWFGDAAVRIQTPANFIGMWMEAGAGLYAGRKQVDTRSGSSDVIKASGRAGPVTHVGLGAQMHPFQAIDLLGELKWMSMPGHFEGDPSLDLGGWTFDVGASLRF